MYDSERGCVRGVEVDPHVEVMEIPKKRRGTFIALEGIEGAGKSTQVKLLQKTISERWGECLATREPGGSPYAEEIRRTIMSEEYGRSASAYTMFELFWAARTDHIENTIRPALLRGAHVITDRFDGTTFSHQIHGQECPELDELFFLKRDVYMADICPDMYIFLDMDPEVGLQRIAVRKGEPLNHFDKRDLDFHMRVREGCKQFAALSLGKSVLINANQPVQGVHDDIIKRLEMSFLFS